MDNYPNTNPNQTTQTRFGLLMKQESGQYMYLCWDDSFLSLWWIKSFQVCGLLAMFSMCLCSLYFRLSLRLWLKRKLWSSKVPSISTSIPAPYVLKNRLFDWSDIQGVCVCWVSSPRWSPCLKNVWCINQTCRGFNILWSPVIATHRLKTHSYLYELLQSSYESKDNVCCLLTMFYLNWLLYCNRWSYLNF